jgi:hypothetical protein
MLKSASVDACFDAKHIGERYERNAPVSDRRDAEAAEGLDPHGVVPASDDLLDRRTRNGVGLPAGADGEGRE